MRIIRTNPSSVPRVWKKRGALARKNLLHAVAPGEIEADAQPTRQPRQVFGRNGTRVEQFLYLLYAPFEAVKNPSGLAR